MRSSVDPALWEAYFAENPDPCFAYGVGTPPAPRFTVAAVNPAWLALTGLSPDIVGQSLEALMPPEVNEVIAKRLERSVAERLRLSYDEELRFRNETRYWRTTIAPVVIDGEVRYLAGYGHDLTDVRNVELERRLQQTQKLESLGVMAGGIAHDFNNLLTGILGHISLMRLEEGCSPQLQEHASYVEIAAQRAAELCRQMLAYSGRSLLSVRRLNLDELVRETTKLLGPSLAKNTELELDLRANGVAVQGDASQLQQVIMNLVLNASEACAGQAGKVTIKTGVESKVRNGRASAHMELDIFEGEFVFLEVLDNGAGMSAQTQTRIFDPFFTTKFTGRGLGLSAVLGIVRGHSGGVGVESELGRGTKFRVLLPIARGEAEPLTTPKPPPGLRGSGTVLVVDDEEVVRTVARRILESLGFAVVMAADGEQAVELVRASKQPFAAVLMDLTMPKLDGVSALQQLRQLGLLVPVLLMSGYTEQDAVARFSGQGLAGFLQKPFTAEMLSAKLGVALQSKT
jgi:PAS domain S-box-containing protein